MKYYRIWLITALWLGFIGTIIWLADHHEARAFFRWIDRHSGVDKLGHFCLFGLLAFFLNFTFWTHPFFNARRYWVPGSALVGILSTMEEFSQRSMPYRTFDLLDMTANWIGVIFFGWLAWWLAAMLAHRASERPKEPIFQQSRSQNEL